jgi:hypothetical protein
LKKEMRAVSGSTWAGSGSWLGMLFLKDWSVQLNISIGRIQAAVDEVGRSVSDNLQTRPRRPAVQDPIARPRYSPSSYRLALQLRGVLQHGELGQLV